MEPSAAGVSDAGASGTASDDPAESSDVGGGDSVALATSEVSLSEEQAEESAVVLGSAGAPRASVGFVREFAPA